MISNPPPIWTLGLFGKAKMTPCMPCMALTLQSGLVAIDLTNMPNYAINMINELGMWVETQDKKYNDSLFQNK